MFFSRGVRSERKVGDKTLFRPPRHQSMPTSLPSQRTAHHLGLNSQRSAHSQPIHHAWVSGNPAHVAFVFFHVSSGSQESPTSLLHTLYPNVASTDCPSTVGSIWGVGDVLPPETPRAACMWEKRDLYRSTPDQATSSVVQ